MENPASTAAKASAGDAALTVAEAAVVDAVGDTEAVASLLSPLHAVLIASAASSTAKPDHARMSTSSPPSSRTLIVLARRTGRVSEYARPCSHFARCYDAASSGHPTC
ncbi:MAG: hypothetical protein DWG79_00010 [Chloroflexi bacterium]|nr:hypothetical protein [Chloroflexota bacterium]